MGADGGGRRDLSSDDVMGGVARRAGGFICRFFLWNLSEFRRCGDAVRRWRSLRLLTSVYNYETPTAFF